MCEITNEKSSPLVSLTSYHTFNLPAYCNELITISDIEQLRSVLSALQTTPAYLLGQGSNTVFVEDFHGVVIRNQIAGKACVARGGSHQLKVGAGESWHELVLWCNKRGIHGLENLALIPGTVGAAPIQNIGAYGVEVERFIDYVEFVDIETGSTERLSAAECQFAYRDSIFKSTLAGKIIISEVGFAIPERWDPVTTYGELAEISEPTPSAVMQRVIDIRRAKLPDPATLGNAGSFFKNPVVDIALFEKLKSNWADIPGYPESAERVKIPAAWLIDSLGFKGKSIGGIRCHPNQPLVLTNTGEGTGEALLTMAREIRDTVKDTFGITLENEVRLIGKNGNIEL